MEQDHPKKKEKKKKKKNEMREVEKRPRSRADDWTSFRGWVSWKGREMAAEATASPAHLPPCTQLGDRPGQIR